MRKVILSNMVTLDGFFEGPHRELDWHVVDEEFNEYANDLLSKVDAILFGRVTYQLMTDYWPAAATNPSTSKSDLEIADKMNNLPKIVFSKTLQKVEWNNSRLVKENIAVEISNMKQQPGKDMVIFGSGSTVSTIMQLGLIDEYRIIAIRKEEEEKIQLLVEALKPAIIQNKHQNSYTTKQGYSKLKAIPSPDFRRKIAV